MSGGREAYERAISERKFRPIAMQVLAAGAIPPAQAIEYVCKLDGVKAILFGASTKAHIQQTKDLIEKFSEDGANPAIRTAGKSKLLNENLYNVAIK